MKVKKLTVHIASKAVIFYVLTYFSSLLYNNSSRENRIKTALPSKINTINSRIVFEKNTAIYFFYSYNL